MFLTYLILLCAILITGKDTPYSDNLSVAHFEAHPSYIPNKNNADIAMIRTKSMIPFNLGVGPVCLPTSSDPLDGRFVEALGWGATSFIGKHSDILKKVTLRVISNNECSSYYGDEVGPGQLCTLSPRADTCQVRL